MSLLQSLDLTTALRPELLTDETLLFVQNSVGLYQGKLKISELQDGYGYLTSHRVCYVDITEPRKHSVALNLSDVERCEFFAGFLKSSAKVTLHLKPSKWRGFQSPSAVGRTAQGASEASTPTFERRESGRSSRQNKATWVCTICTFSNPVPATFDPATANANTPLTPCQNCGIKPAFPQILKAAINAAAGRYTLHSPASSSVPLQPPPADTNSSQGRHQELVDRSGRTATRGTQCPRCTFLNHPSLLVCELCGSTLIPREERSPFLPEPPVSPSIRGGQVVNDEPGVFKVSFRAGGEKMFFERLQGALTQRKWLLRSAPPIPLPVGASSGNGHSPSSSNSTQYDTTEVTAGIAGLERRGLQMRLKNEAVIGSAFSDLDALRASAKEIIALAESFAVRSTSSNPNVTDTDASQLIVESAKALEMVTTRDTAGGQGDMSLFLSEMSRNLAEYLTDDSKQILRREGGIISLVDLWAMFNRARSDGGFDLISPVEFEQAARLLEKLHLPVRLRQFKSGLLVVQEANRTDDKTIAQLLGWLQELHADTSDVFGSINPGTNDECTWDTALFGRGVTAQETAQHFGWSVGVASEELEMAEIKGALCRDGETATGTVTFWENWITDLKEDDEVDLHAGLKFAGGPQDEELVRKLEDIGLL